MPYDHLTVSSEDLNTMQEEIFQLSQGSQAEGEAGAGTGTPKDSILSLANRTRQGELQNHFSDIR